MAYYRQPAPNKDLPPVPPKGLTTNNQSFQSVQAGGQVPNVIHDEDEFNFVDPNAHIDNSFRDSLAKPSNPNLSLNNRIIYDYDTDNDSDAGTNSAAITAHNNALSARRELAAHNASANEFYSNSNVSRQSSTKSNPFKEDPFADGGSGSKRNSAMSRNRPFDEPDSAFDNVPIRYNATSPDPNASTSLLNPYRNNKFYNNENTTMNGGFRVDDEFSPNELRPRYIMDPAAEKPPPSGLLVWRGKKLPIVSYVFTLIQCIVFIAELAKMGKLTGSPVQTKPYFNPMIGPSSYLQINMGSRFVPCMISIPGLSNLTSDVFPCPNSTSIPSGCQLSYLCGMNGMDEKNGAFVPRQWYRIITPIFLHAGFIHIFCNMALQMLLGVDMERQIGSGVFLVIYMAAGISGNVFGANFAQQGMSSSGASGALFGIIGVNLIFFIFFTNKSQIHPKVYKRNLSYLIGEIIFTLILGLLPGLDNFSHIGGFVAGCLLSVVLFKDPNFVFQDRYRYQRDPKELNKSAIPARSSLNSFTPFEYDGANAEGSAPQVNNLHVINSKVHKFLPNMNTRKPQIFFSWVVARVIAGLLVFLWFYLLCVNLFRNGGGHCKWCKYLSCIPVKDWCTMGTISLEEIGNSSSSIVLGFFMMFIGGHMKLINRVKQKLD